MQFVLLRARRTTKQTSNKLEIITEFNKQRKIENNLDKVVLQTFFFLNKVFQSQEKDPH